MKKTTKLLCFLLSASLILSCLPAMGVLADVAANGFYCDFDEITLRTLDDDAVSSSEFMAEGLAFVDNPAGILVEDRSNDGNRGLHLYSSAAVGAALPTAVDSGMVKVTLTVYPMAQATYVYLASAMGSGLATSQYTTIGKFGNLFTLGSNGSALSMRQNRYNRIELIADLDEGTLAGYCDGTLIGTLTGLNFESAAGVIVGGNGTLAQNVANKPLLGDLGISTYTDDDTFSCVDAQDSAIGSVHTTTVMFDEPVDDDTLPSPSAVTIKSTVGEQSFKADSISAYGPSIILNWSGEMSAGNEYRIDFGAGLKSIYNRPLNDGAYITGPFSVSTTTLIDENFDGLSTQNLDVSTGRNTATGIYKLGNEDGTEDKNVESDTNMSVSDADAFCFNKATDRPGFLKMPHGDSAYPYGDAPYTAQDGNYAAVPYESCSATQTDNKFYRLGDLTKTELGTMPDSGIIRWSFDYLWEYGSSTNITKTTLKWGGTNITGWCHSDYVLNSLKYNVNDTNTWNSVVVEYDASNKKVRYGTNDDDLCAWKAQDMSSCEWLVLPAELSVQRLCFAIDNVKVTYTNTPLYVEGVRYVALDGAMTGSSSIQAETEKINIYFSAPVANDIASHVTIDGSTVSSYELSADKKLLTINTGLFKGNSIVDLAIDSAAASATGIKIAAEKSYTLTIGSGHFSLENLSGILTAATPGTITAGDKVTVKADAINTIADAQSYTLVAAYYNGGSLVELIYQPCSLTNAEYFKKESYDLTPTATGKTYDTVKVFAWNSITEHWAIVEAVSY